MIRLTSFLVLISLIIPFKVANAEGSWVGEWLVRGEWQMMQSGYKLDHFVCRFRQRTETTGEIGCPTRFERGNMGGVVGSSTIGWKPIVISGNQIRFDLYGYNGDRSSLYWESEVTVEKVFKDRLEGEEIQTIYRPKANPKLRETNLRYRIAFVRK
jgi:hypothetical protein